MPASTRTPSQAAQRRPLWMMAALAFGLAPVLAGLLFDEALGAARNAIAAALRLDDEQRELWHLLRVLLRFALPTLVMLALLRFTALGRWLVLTPATLALLLMTDIFLVVYLADQISLMVLNGSGVFHEALKFPAVSGLALGSLCGATLLLAWATAWHRSPGWRAWLTRTGQRWLRTV